MLKEIMENQSITTIPDQVAVKQIDNKKRKKAPLDGHHHSSRLKRPVRLLPPHILRGDKNETSTKSPVPKFYGPPINCFDLSRLGYTLNGFYQVQSNTSTKNDDGLKPETIYCAFKQPEGIFNLSAVEKRLPIATNLKFDSTVAARHRLVI